MLRSFEGWFKKTPDVPPKTWTAGTIQESGRGRSLETYVKEFNIDVPELNDKIVLDLGAGLENRFSEELKNINPKAVVVALSPDYSDKTTRERVTASSPETPKVAGLGDSLPFSEATFDKVYALHVYEHLLNKNRDLVFKTLVEMARVLKAGGEAKIGPVFNTPNSISDFEILSSDKNLLDSLKRYNVVFQMENISNDLPKAKIKDQYGNAFYLSGYNLVLKKSLTREGSREK